MLQLQETIGVMRMYSPGPTIRLAARHARVADGSLWP